MPFVRNMPIAPVRSIHGSFRAKGKTINRTRWLKVSHCRSPSQHQHQSQHQPPPPTRWPPDRGHCQWPPALEWSPAGRGHHPCLTPHSRWPAQKPSRKVRRSRTTRCPQKQRKNVPRPPQQPTLPFGRACNRGAGQMEWGGRRRLHQQPGTSQSQTGTHHPPTKRCGCSHRKLVRHVDPCSHGPLRSHPSWWNYTKSLRVNFLTARFSFARSSRLDPKRISIHTCRTQPPWMACNMAKR